MVTWSSADHDTTVCGRYAVAFVASEAAAELRAELTVQHFPKRYNLAPTDPAPICIEAYPSGTRKIGLARFGLVPAQSDGPQTLGARYVNLRAEGLALRRMFAHLLARRRCLVLASGFYEWQPTDEPGRKKRKQPFYFRAELGALLTFAGVWDVWENARGEPLASFSILTTRADALVAPVHDRMPLIVPPGMRDTWLDTRRTDGPTALHAIEQADPVPLEAWRVGAAVGRATHDAPELIAPIDGERRRTRAS